MTPLVRRPHRPVGLVILLVALVVVGAALVTTGDEMGLFVSTHRRTLVVFVGIIALGAQLRLRMPSGREALPLASASALAVAFVGPVDGEPTLDIESGQVVLIVAVGLGMATVGRLVRGREHEVTQLAARLLGVAVAAGLARGFAPGGESLWEAQSDSTVNQGLVATGLAVVATVGLVVELVLISAIRAERQRSPWSAAVRDELGEAAPLTFAVVVTGPMVALMAPYLGLLALPVALVPLAMAYSAVGQYARNRATNRQLIATLSRLTEEGGYTPRQHAERVSGLSVRVGRVLGLGDRELRDIEYAALLHDLGQILLHEPIPDGATVLAAPGDQRDIALEGARIIRRAQTLDAVADYVEAQTTPYRLVRELGGDVPLASRIIKAANAFDDLTLGSEDPAAVAAAMERIHLGLGYEYDPDVVDALTRVTEDRATGRVGEDVVVAR